MWKRCNHSTMPDSQYLSVIRVWAALAWADGVIAQAEAVAMRRLVEAADLSDDERNTALGWLENKVDLDIENLGSLSEKAREGIYRAAARLASVDMDVADEERAFLGRLREGLGITDEVAKDIESGIPGYG